MRQAIALIVLGGAVLLPACATRTSQPATDLRYDLNRIERVESDADRNHTEVYWLRKPRVKD